MKSLLTLCLSILCLSPLVGSSQTIKTVESRGVGSSEKTAVNDASRNAISQVLDTLVESQTIVIDDQVVEDKIIAVAGGYIKDYEIIEPAKKTSEGFYVVRIRANVKSDKLSEQITHYSSTVTTFNMGAVMGEIEQQEKKKQTASMLKEEKQMQMAEFIHKMLDDYMKLWKFTATKCIPGKLPNTVDVEVSALLKNNDYMQKFFKPMRKKLNRLGVQPSRNLNGPGIHMELNPINTPSYGGFLIFEFEVFYDNKKVSKNFNQFVAQKWQAQKAILQIELKNSAGDVLASKDISLRRFASHSNLMGARIDSIGVWIGSFNNQYNNPLKLGKPENLAKKVFQFSLYEPYKITDIASIAVKMKRVDARTPCDEIWDGNRP